jgi:ribosomal protein S18 acetylase RimI-like enzyme
MEAVIVRLLTPEDASAMWHLRKEALELCPGAFGESVEEHIRQPITVSEQRLRDGPPDNFVAGAFQNGELIGMIGFLRSHGVKSRHKGRIWGVYVGSRARGSGVGTKLLELVLQTAHGLDGVRAVVLTVAENNYPAVALYRRAGFQEFGREPAALQVNGEFLTELFMRLEFAPSGG